jgi:hypothetical protein
MVPQSAVIVWQMGGFVEEVDCYFVKRTSAFTLTVERAGESLAEEQYSSLHETMVRAGELRRSLTKVGFLPVAASEAEPQPVLDSLLRHFVKEGTAALYVGYGA